MRYFFLYTLLARLLRQPLLILILFILLYFIIDRRFVGLLPDLGRPWRRRHHMSQLEEEIRLNPANARAQSELGALYLERGDIRRALPFLEKARERMNDSATVMALLGACYFRLSRDEQAGEALAEAVSINPKVRYGEPYYYLLALELRAGRQVQTGEDGLKEHILSCGSPEVFYRTGRALLAAGDREGAREMFSEVLANYQAVPGRLRRPHRRWAFLAWVFLKFSG